MTSWAFHRVSEVEGYEKRKLTQIVQKDPDYEQMTSYLGEAEDVTFGYLNDSERTAEEATDEPRVFRVETPDSESYETIAVPAITETDDERGGGILVRLKNKVVQKVRATISYADRDYVEVHEHILREGEIASEYLEMQLTEFTKKVQERITDPKLRCSVCLFACSVTVAGAVIVAPFAAAIFFAPFLPAIMCTALAHIVVGVAEDFSPVSRRDVCDEIGLCKPLEQDPE